MSRLTEIQKAIEELAPRKGRNFASGSTNVIVSWKGSGPKLPKERLRGIEAGERKTIDAVEVFAEARRIAEQ